MFNYPIGPLCGPCIAAIAGYFSEFIHQDAINFRFRKPLQKKCFQSEIIFLSTSQILSLNIFLWAFRWILYSADILLKTKECMFVCVSGDMTVKSVHYAICKFVNKIRVCILPCSFQSAFLNQERQFSFGYILL